MVLSMHSGTVFYYRILCVFVFLLLTHSSLLQAKRCVASMADTLAVPHISDADNSFGLI